MELDKLDRNILNILQTRADIPLKELAAQVHSSIATCQCHLPAAHQKPDRTRRHHPPSRHRLTSGSRLEHQRLCPS